MEASLKPGSSARTKSLGDTLGAWWQAGRPPFFIATLIPLTLGGVIAAKQGDWHTLRWLVVVSGSFMVHLATNLGNDYFDYYAGTDDGDSVGGSRVIQESKIRPPQLKSAMILLYTASIVCGVWLTWVSGVWWLAVLTAFALWSSIFYTAPPVRYGYHGLGELFVGLNMGPVMVAGCAAALTGDLVWRAVWLSVPVAILVASILYYQSLPDMDSDRRAGKITIAVRLGKSRALWGLRLFFIASIGSIILLATVGIIHPLGFASILTIVQAFRIDRMISRTSRWVDLHDQGGAVRVFYMVNGLILILSVVTA